VKTKKIEFYHGFLVFEVFFLQAIIHQMKGIMKKSKNERKKAIVIARDPPYAGDSFSFV
jgi:hypothetical protein